MYDSYLISFISPLYQSESDRIGSDRLYPTLLSAVDSAPSSPHHDDAHEIATGVVPPVENPNSNSNSNPTDNSTNQPPSSTTASTSNDNTNSAQSNSSSFTPTRPRLHISSLPSRWGNTEASAYFAQFGTVTDVVVFRESNRFGSERSNGPRSKYGFIEFSTMESAVAAIDGSNGVRVEDSTLAVKFAAPKSSGQYGPPTSNSSTPSSSDTNARLYVGSFGKGVSEDDMRREFEKYGRTVSVSIFPNFRASQRRGGGTEFAAFVQFEKNEDAKLAKDALHGSQALRGDEANLRDPPDGFVPTPPLIVDFAK